MDIDMKGESDTIANFDDRVRYCLWAFRSIKLNYRNPNNQISGPQNKGNPYLEGGNDRFQRAKGINTYRAVSREHGNVGGKPKVPLRTRFKELSSNAQSHPRHELLTILEAGESSPEGESGQLFSKKKREVPEKEVTTKAQLINEFHNLEC